MDRYKVILTIEDVSKDQVPGLEIQTQIFKEGTGEIKVNTISAEDASDSSTLSFLRVIKEVLNLTAEKEDEK